MEDGKPYLWSRLEICIENLGFSGFDEKDWNFRFVRDGFCLGVEVNVERVRRVLFRTLIPIFSD